MMSVMLRKQNATRWISAGACLMLLLGCSKGSDSGTPDSGTQSSSGGIAVNYSQYAKTSTVCSPLNGSAPSTVPFLTYGNGLQGRLYSLLPGAPTPQNLSQQFSNSADVGVDLFLNDLNVPTRLFSEGFPAADGHLLTGMDGSTLVEYFGMQLTSELQLSTGDAEGNYQLALIADDGATLSVKALGNNDYTTLIDDDGVHPSKMLCATSPLEFHTYDRIPINVQYFQGPRYHISLMLMWRPWPKDASAVNDPLCGTEGNSQFFDPNQVPSTPQQNYKDLLARGWKPLVTGNYAIPELGFNPCQVIDYWSAQ